MRDGPSVTVVIGVDGNPTYTRHLDVVRSAWGRVGFNVHVVSVDPGRVPDADSEMRLDARIPLARAAQMSRWLLAPDIPAADIVMLSDADMVPLKPAAFHDAVSRYESQQLLAVGGDAYNVGNYFQVCYLAAEPRVWRQIVDPHGWGIDGWVARWLETGVLTGAAFEDEPILKLLIESWGGNVNVIPRHQWRRGPCGGRIERAACCTETSVGLSRFIDAHLPRGDAPIHGVEDLIAAAEPVVRQNA